MAPPMTLAAWWRVLRPRRSHLDVALEDWRARRAGYCRALAADGNLDRHVGGYRHWRCDRRRGHTGPHRSINYTWTSRPFSTTYRPVNVDDDRAAMVAADTVDADPLPMLHTDRHLMHDTYGQQLRGVMWQARTQARNGYGHATPGQVFALLRRPSAVVATLFAARRLDEDLTRMIRDGQVVVVEAETSEVLELYMRKVHEASAKAGTP